jgi:hypothetical protein
MALRRISNFRMNEKQGKKSRIHKEFCKIITSGRNKFSQLDSGDSLDGAGLPPWRRCRRRGIIPSKENRP